MTPRVALIALCGLLVVTAVTYLPVWHGLPVWDDGGHLTRVDLQSWDGLRRIWLEPGATQQYYPVLHSAFWIEHQLWGQAPLGYHLVNIVWHALSAWFVLLILQRVHLPGAALAALIFAVHPVHVESVAWISEQKNTLSGVFALSALLLYLRFDTTRRARDYGLVVLLFALALLSKSVTATLPVVLAIILWWQRGSLRWREDVWPLLPLAAMSLAAGVTTVFVERGMIGADGAQFSHWFDRVLVAGRAAWFYLASLVWPIGLAFNYPRWSVDASVWWQWLFPLALVAVLVVLWRRRAQWGRGPLAALLVFLAAVSPALGFVDVYPFRFSFVADHFQYLASLGVIAAAAAGMAMLAQRWRLADAGRVAGTAMVCVPLAVLSWQQSGHYVDEETLYGATLERNPDSWLAHTNLAALLLERPDGDVAAALGHARAAVAVVRDSPAVHYTMAQALERTGDTKGAAVHYRAALALFRTGEHGFQRERLSQLRLRLGIVLAANGEFADAITQFEAALQDERSAATLNNLAGAHLQAGHFAEAVPLLEEAVARDPNMSDAFYNLGSVMARLGRWTDAIAAYQRVMKLEGASANLLVRLGTLFARAGDPQQAAQHFGEALRLDPSHPGAQAAVRGGGRN